MPQQPPAPGGLGAAPLFEAVTCDDWERIEALKHQGLIVRRPELAGRFNGYHRELDRLMENFTTAEGPGELRETVEHGGDPDAARTMGLDAAKKLLARAHLPEALNQQIRADAATLSKVVASLVPAAMELDVKLELFGLNSCSRWHQDRYVARALVSYTGEVGTMYTPDDNVDFWEMGNCGNNDCIIRDKGKIESIGVCDLFLIKGFKYPDGAKALVHKSADHRYHADGRVVNRLLLKVDVPSLPDEAWHGME